MKDKIIRVLLDDALWKENYKSFESFLDLLQSEYETQACETKYEDRDYKIEGYFIGSAFKREEIAEIINSTEPFLKPFSPKFVYDHNRTFHRIFTEDSGKLFIRLAGELIDSAYENLSGSNLDQELIDSKIKDIENWLKNIDRSKEEIAISNTTGFRAWLKEIRKLESDLNRPMPSKQAAESSEQLAPIDLGKGNTRSFSSTSWISSEDARSLTSILILFGISYLLSEHYREQILSAIQLDKLDKEERLNTSLSSVAAQPSGEIQPPNSTEDIDRRDSSTNSNTLLTADTTLVSIAAESSDAIDRSPSGDLRNLIITTPSPSSSEPDVKENIKGEQAKIVELKNDPITPTYVVHDSNIKRNLTPSSQHVEVASEQTQQAETSTSKTTPSKGGDRGKNGNSVSSDDKSTQDGIDEPIRSTEPTVVPLNKSISPSKPPQEGAPTLSDSFIKDAPNDSSNLIFSTPLLSSSETDIKEEQARTVAPKNEQVTLIPVAHDRNTERNLTSPTSQKDSLLGIQNETLVQGDIGSNADSIIGNTNFTTNAFSTKENLVGSTLNTSANSFDSNYLTNSNDSFSQGSLNQQATYSSDLTSYLIGSTQQQHIGLNISMPNIHFKQS